MKGNEMKNKLRFLCNIVKENSQIHDKILPHKKLIQLFYVTI